MGESIKRTRHFVSPSLSSSCQIKFCSLQTKQKAGERAGQTGRTGVKCVKRKPNKGGGGAGGDKVDLVVLLDLVRALSVVIFPTQMSPLPSSL